VQFNVSTGYAFRIMIYLAKNDRTVSSTELSENILISRRYLLQIASKLRDGRLVETSMGMSGGYTLLKKPSLITAYDIILQIEGGVFIPNSIDDKKNEKSNLYFTMNLLKNYAEAYLNSVTLEKLADKKADVQRIEFNNMIESQIASLKHNDQWEG